jgi:probable selenium-dependent hydroxylase accessory protein YqeC
MIFDLVRGDTVCVTGAGGKTSLIRFTAEQLCANGMSVLISTTTRMLLSEVDKYTCAQGVKNPAKSIYALYETEGIKASPHNQLAEIRKSFDITLIEADGSACLPMKGWKDTEPVIPDCTTVTIGVLDTSMTGRVLDDKTVHRFDIFKKLASYEDGEKLDVRHLERIINNPNGIFRNAKGRKILYCAKCESDSRTAKKLSRLTDAEVYAGSVITGVITRC